MSKRVSRAWRRFPGECRSTAALEFALTAPLLILIGLGVVEFSAAVRADLNIHRAARYVAEILQNQTSVSAAALQDYFYAAQYMYANGGINGTLALSAASIKFTNLDSNGNATTFSSCTGWDAANDGAAPAYSALPAAALKNIATLSDSYDNDSTIVVEASATLTLPFMPSFFGRMPQSFTFTAISRARPRYVLQIPTNPSPGFSQC
jgi:Flp pilus assembly protein TadG